VRLTSRERDKQGKARASVKTLPWHPKNKVAGEGLGGVTSDKGMVRELELMKKRWER